jgi:hypothetical protein
LLENLNGAIFCAFIVTVVIPTDGIAETLIDTGDFGKMFTQEVMNRLSKEKIFNPQRS